MKKLQSLLFGVVSSVVMFTALFSIFGVNAKAVGPNNFYWNYKTDKAVVSVNDQYSSSQNAFKSVTWKLLSEVQLKEIANGIGTTNIKLSRDFNSGDVILGMKTDNAELALRAFQKMTFGGKTSQYLQIERLDYYAGTDSSIIIVRCDPQTKTEYSVRPYGFTYDGFGGVAFVVKTPKNDLKIEYFDSQTLQTATVRYMDYSFVKRPHTNISDICISGIVGRTITGAPNVTSYCPGMILSIKEASIGGKKQYVTCYLFNKDEVAYKRGQYKKTYGFTNVEMWMNNSKYSTLYFKK